ncbi:MAG: metallophosphoesterase [Pseudomonadota bacterium]
MTTHKTQYRTLWISDVHLGMRWCQAEFLLDFLKHHECETLYLVGDIIDGWQLKRSWRWPDSHKQVLLALREKIQNGTKVYYVPGNHDVFLRYSPNAVGTASNELFHQVLHNFFQKDLAGFIIQREIVHETIDGRKLLVLHGDEFDNLGQCADLLETIGNIAYARMLELNWCFNKIRQRLGLRYWSMSAWLKHRVKSAINFIKDYESSMAAEARRRGLDGIVQAVTELALTVPVVVRLEGANADLAKQILDESDVDVISADSLADAAEKVVASATKGGQ